ncbi:MAG UNVERIFIED_CONTAM: hypothetical protein LVR18_14900 [Planctomycetaceae bacterium]|jgi:hypothetical protein
MNVANWPAVTPVLNCDRWPSFEDWRKARRVAWSIDMLWRLAESSNIQIRRESQSPPERF